MTRSRRRFDLSFRPKSYWPPRKRSRAEVEIARIAISSSSRDAIILSARRDDSGRIRYRFAPASRTGMTEVEVFIPARWISA